MAVLDAAPERFHAKWFMFASIMCILVGPVLSFGSFFVGERKQSAPRAGKDASTILLREMDEYKRSMKTLDTSHYVELAGDFAALLSSVFFVLFLRRWPSVVTMPSGHAWRCSTFSSPYCSLPQSSSSW